MRTERTPLKARLLAIFLVIVMVIGMMPGAAFAAEGDETPSAPPSGDEDFQNPDEEESSDITITLEMDGQATVTVGGVILTADESVQLQPGDDAEIEITASTGYVLVAVVVDGAEQEVPEGSTTWSGTFFLENDTLIQVTLQDVQAPVITGVEVTTAWTNESQTVTVTVEDNSGSAVLYYYSAEDTAESATQVTGNSFEVGANGDYVIYAVDAAGNTGEEQTFTVTGIDLDPPQVEVSAEEVWAKEIVVTVTADDGEGSGVGYVLWSSTNNMNGAVEAEENNGVYTFTVQTNGTYYVWAVDNVGNATYLSQTVWVHYVDTASPTMAVTADPENWTNDTVVISVQATDLQSGIASVVWMEEGQEAAEIALNEDGEGSFSVTETEDGAHIITIIATDNAGNAEYATATVKYDGTRPTVVITTTASSEWTNQDITVEGTFQDETSGVASVSYSNQEDYSTATLLDVDLESGTYSFVVGENATYYVWAKDVAGNISIVQSIEIANIDKVNPQVTITDGNHGGWLRSDAQILVSATDDLSGISAVYWNLNGSDTPQGQASLQSDGTYVITVSKRNFSGECYVWAVDNAGNISAVVSTVLTMDEDPPEITAVAANPGSWTNTSVTISGTTTDGRDAYSSGVVAVYYATVEDSSQATDEGITFNSTTGSFSLVIDNAEDCDMTVYFWAEDAAGNLSECSTTTVQIDVTQPTATLELVQTGTVWDKLISALSFGLWDNMGLEVVITAEDASCATCNSGVDTVAWYKVSGEAATTLLGQSDLEALNAAAWTEGESLAVTQDEQFVVYAKVTDVAGNVAYFSTDGAIVDTVAAGITLAASQPNVDNGNSDVYGYYTDDVTVEIQVADEAPYSGIATVEYWVTADGEETQRGTLYSFGYSQNSYGTQTEWSITGSDVEGEDGTYTDAPTQDMLKATWSGSIVVDAEQNNSCDVVVTVQVTDNAGNVQQQSIALDIDVVAPTIAVSYDNNAAANSTYFDAARTATVTITERAHHFDAATATQGLVITAVDANGNAVTLSSDMISDWVQSDGAAADQTTFTATITFDVDANYTLAVSFADAAGNKAGSADSGSSVAPWSFTVDTVAPLGSVTATTEEGTVLSWSSLITNLTFGLWSNSGISVTGEYSDATSAVYSVKYIKTDSVTAMTWAELEEVTDWGDFTTLTVKPNEQCTVYLKITDMAGNYTYISTNGMIADDTAPRDETLAPEVTVTPQQPINGLYNGDVTVDITVTDPTVGSTYSGLKTVVYRVYNMGVLTQEGVLYENTNSNPTSSELVQSWSGSIVVSSALNNSNDVRVEVYAQDNALNDNTATTSMQIDITAPTIVVSYDNNNPDSTSYYNASRTATIVVTERNFDADDVVVTITNTEGTIPAVVGWTTVAGTGNGDNTTHTATVTFAADGDYTLALAYTDEAGNVATSINYTGTTPTEFTIDCTKPVVSVSYDVNDAQNGNYYSAVRTATITITEHNFTADRVVITMTATDDGAAITVPTVSGWTGTGDTHTATVVYPGDGLYTFDIAVTDLAGNDSDDYAQDTFYVDLTTPEITIEGVADRSANRGDVIPVITISDTNFSSSLVSITLTGANRGAVELDGDYSSIHNGIVFTFQNFPEEEYVDDIYTLSVVVTDLAGNANELTCQFSVNRFGSTYLLSDATSALLGTYVTEATDLVITEINPDELSNIKITLFKNAETIVLTEGVDYSITVEGGDGGWYSYTYTIFASNFTDDGVYRIVIHSEDAAENVAENTLDTKGAEISFGVDKTAPNVVVTNVESRTTYAVDSLTVILYASDNLLLDSLEVYLDSETEVYCSWDSDAVSASADGEFTFDISGDSVSAHTLKVLCTDAAGNTFEEEISNFYVTTNMWVRYYTNTPLVVGSILGAAALIGIVAALVIKTRKKK